MYMRPAQFLSNLEILRFIINRTICKSKDKTRAVYVSSTRKKTSNEEITESRSKPGESKGKKEYREEIERSGVQYQFRGQREMRIFLLIKPAQPRTVLAP